MTTINQSELTNILKLVAGLFNAAPGKEYLNEFTEAYIANGRNLEVLAESMGQTDAFKSVYPSFLTVEAFTTQFLTTLGLEDNEEAQAFVATKVAAGESFASVIYQSLVALVESTSDEFAAARDQLSNKAAVAEHFSVTLGRSSDDLAVLQGAIAGVTDDPATVEAAKEANEAGANEGQTFTLTTDIGETIVGTNGDDTINGIIDATTPANSTWNTFDSIDGRGGRDTLNLLTVGAGAVIPPTATTLANVEVIRVASETELTAIDVSTLDGVDSVVVAGAGATAVTLGEGQSVTLANSAATSAGVTVTVDADETDTTITLAGVASGEDVTLAGAANESLTVNGAVAGAGVVTINAAATTETLNLGLTSDGTVTITGAALTDIDASGSTGDVVMAGAVGTVETITGGEGDDTLIGGTASELIEGGAGDDTITAGNVAGEVIIGGLGADDITLGTAGQAQEVVINVGDSGLTIATMDEITDFTTGEDTLNFGLADGDADNFLDGGASSSFIDALTNANTAFFTGSGELQYFLSNAGGNGYLFVDADLNGTADMAIQLTGTTTIVATDIIAGA